MNKILLLISAGIFVLVGITFLLKKNNNPSDDIYRGQPIIREGLYEESIDAIEFGNTAGSFAITKENGLWIVDQLNFPADTGILFNLLNRMNTDTVVETVAKESDSYAGFGFTGSDQRGTAYVSFKQDGKVIARLNIGKSREGGGQYIKRDGVDAVWLITDSLTLIGSAAEAIEKKPLTVSPAEVTKVVLNVPNLSAELTLNDSSTDSSADAAAAGKPTFIDSSGSDRLSEQTVGMLEVFHPLNIKSIRNEPPLDENTKPTGQLQLQLTENNTMAVDVFLKQMENDKAYFLKLTFSDTFNLLNNNRSKLLNGVYFEIQEATAKKLLYE